MAQVHLSDICLLLTGAMCDGLIRLEDSADQNVDPILKHSLEINRILSLKILQAFDFGLEIHGDTIGSTTRAHHSNHSSLIEVLASLCTYELRIFSRICRTEVDYLLIVTSCATTLLS